MMNRLFAISLVLIALIVWPFIRWAAVQLHSAFPVWGLDLLMLVALLAGPVTVVIRGARRSS